MDVQPSLRRPSGFSMIEVLVATLILSFGISSIGMMMLATLKNARGTMFRSKAVGFAQDMVERIRANYEGREFYNTSTTTGTNHNCFQAGSGEPPPCSEQHLAEHDVWQWRETLTDSVSGLPGASGSITRDTSTTPPEYIITVNWADSQASDGSAVTESFTLRTRP